MKKKYVKPEISVYSVENQGDVLQASHIHIISGTIQGEDVGGANIDRIEMDWGGSSDKDKEKDGSGNIWAD